MSKCSLSQKREASEGGTNNSPSAQSLLVPCLSALGARPRTTPAGPRNEQPPEQRRARDKIGMWAAGHGGYGGHGGGHRRKPHPPPLPWLAPHLLARAVLCPRPACLVLSYGRDAGRPGVCLLVRPGSRLAAPTEHSCKLIPAPECLGHLVAGRLDHLVLGASWQGRRTRDRGPTAV